MKALYKEQQHESGNGADLTQSSEELEVDTILQTFKSTKYDSLSDQMQSVLQEIKLRLRTERTIGKLTSDEFRDRLLNFDADLLKSPINLPNYKDSAQNERDSLKFEIDSNIKRNPLSKFIV